MVQPALQLDPVAPKVAPHLPRVVSPEATVERLAPDLGRLGITRVANITGLDRIGIPVVAVMRPNSRSYAVSQGKGTTLAAAKASGIMESIETWHAEEVCRPLRHGRFRELRRRFSIADVSGLPRLTSSQYGDDTPILWSEGARDIITGEWKLLPHELVHLDFRLPRAAGSGSFLASSNGLASGNHLLEAVSHGLCELIERDANTLWQLSGEAAQALRRIDLESVEDASCRVLLERLDAADVDVLAWDTTTDVGVASISCDILDRSPDVAGPMPPIRGSGAHPCRAVALSRALTEAAQGRLTRISGARDDLFNGAFDAREAQRMTAAAQALQREQRPRIVFSSLPNAEHPSLSEDVAWLCDHLYAAGLREILAVDLTRADLKLPVVRMVVPHLEGMSEVPGYVPGARARRAMERAA